MADYTEILDDEILPDSPGTSTLFFRLRDNPEAIAEGAPDAPRIAAIAMGGGQLLPYLAGGAAVDVALIDLDLISEINIHTVNLVGTLDISLSDNNGSSWGSRQTVGTWEIGWGMLNLDTGAWTSLGNSGVLTLPAGPVNAIRVRASGPGAGLSMQPFIAGGRE